MSARAMPSAVFSDSVSLAADTEAQQQAAIRASIRQSFSLTGPTAADKDMEEAGRPTEEERTRRRSLISWVSNAS